MRIAVYALAKNESANVAAWESSCRDADVRVVTDTGSTDNTVQLLEAAGVTVARGSPVPWRWDDAHNLSMQHVPADVDVCIRLDLDEVLDTGWRAALEAAWKPGSTRGRYWYHWSTDVRFLSDRVHARAGYRWAGATHEGLVCWSGEDVQAWLEGFTIRHHRQPGKAHKTDLTLLRQAVRESPTDARMAWYLARELDYAHDPETAAAFHAYLQMPGGAPTERAYAFRVLARLEPDKARRHLLATVLESPSEPEAYLAFARQAYEMDDWVSAVYWARQAVACPPESQTHASDPVAYSAEPADIGSAAAWRLGLHREASMLARVAFARGPGDRRLAANVAALERMNTEDGPKAA